MVTNLCQNVSADHKVSNNILKYQYNFYESRKHSKNNAIFKVSKGAKIRNRYNQVPHLTQDTNGKVTNSQLDNTNESQEDSPFPAGDHKAHINRHTKRHSKHKTEKKIHKRITALERLVKYFTGGLKPGFKAPTLPLIQMWIKIFGWHEIPLTYQCIIS